MRAEIVAVGLVTSVLLSATFFSRHSQLQPPAPLDINVRHLWASSPRSRFSSDTKAQDQVTVTLSTLPVHAATSAQTTQRKLVQRAERAAQIVATHQGLPATALKNATPVVLTKPVTKWDLGWAKRPSTSRLLLGADLVHYGTAKVPQMMQPPHLHWPESTATLLVHSYGGVGTSTYMNAMPKSAAFQRAKLVMNAGTDEDGLKHGPVIETWELLCFQAKATAEALSVCNPKVRAVIYFFENPVHAVLSLFRRDFASMQIGKLRPALAACKFVHLQQLGSAGSRAARRVSVGYLSKMNLEEYANLGLDILGFMDTITDWLLASCDSSMRFQTVTAQPLLAACGYVG